MAEKETQEREAKEKAAQREKQIKRLLNLMIK